MVYLAMTAAELQNCITPPAKIAWMACHFSPYGTGLTNLPASLPKSSILILNDRTPVHRHDPKRIADTLRETVERLQCSAVLLDFQRPGCEETAQITKHILSIPCPVCVSAPYAQNRDCPIFVPPVPLLKSPEEYLSAWENREIWLELEPTGGVVTITDKGARVEEELLIQSPCPNFDEQLICHFGMDFDQKKAVFTLKRHENDLQKMMDAAEKLGVRRFIGLWQAFSAAGYFQ